MPQVMNPSGVPVNVPQTLNGKDLKKALNIPENRILTRVNQQGDEEVIRNSDAVSLREGDRFDSATSFERGA
jgi:hypothetical protein